MLDTTAFLRIARPGGVANIEGERVPVVLPLEDLEDHTEFDRQICAAGLKRFLRPLAPSDQPDPAGVYGPEAPRFTGSHILVHELTEGVRGRAGIQLWDLAAAN
jgi:hypothetical protein